MINKCYKNTQLNWAHHRDSGTPKMAQNGLKTGIFGNKNSYRPEIHNNEACFSVGYLVDIWGYKTPLTAFLLLCFFENSRTFKGRYHFSQFDHSFAGPKVLLWIIFSDKKTFKQIIRAYLHIIGARLVQGQTS